MVKGSGSSDLCRSVGVGRGRGWTRLTGPVTQTNFIPVVNKHTAVGEALLFRGSIHPLVIFQMWTLFHVGEAFFVRNCIGSLVMLKGTSSPSYIFFCPSQKAQYFKRKEKKWLFLFSYPLPSITIIFTGESPQLCMSSDLGRVPSQLISVFCNSHLLYKSLYTYTHTHSHSIKQLSFCNLM